MAIPKSETFEALQNIVLDKKVLEDLSFLTKFCHTGVIAALQIRAGQRLITANLRPLTAHIYHLMIIVNGGFSKKSFIINIIFISTKFSERS